jgi:hypothetical protein
MDGVTPDGLGESGSRLWGKVVADWDLDPSDFELLLQACRTADELDRLGKALEGAEPFVKGSTGQTKIHPGFEELRRHRAILATLLGKLDISDAEEPEQTPEQKWRSDRARNASNARWHPHARPA